MNSELVKGKPLSKQEIKTLLKLIEANKVITTRGTNAHLNKLKNAAWKKLTRTFNTTIAITPRTPQQLRLKWENLKKNARRRSARIMMNGLQITPEYIPPDDILDRVSKLLVPRHSSSRNDDPLGDDKKSEGIVEDGSDDSHNGVPPDDDEGCIQYPEVRMLSVDSNPNDHEGSDCTDKVLIMDCPEPQDEEQTFDKTPEALNFDTSRRVNRRMTTELQSSKSRIARNQAIAEYFIAKKQCLEAKMENVILKNENLKSEKEMLKLQNIKLKLEIEKLKA
ncbi:uncharacterized protein [Epargyreus clarus]|uniref:uncharacterized protein n=1 Tax=Epargyreus clarus TaxID=520877 RepID=UPI003C2B8AE5